ncbi:hypothetical protein EAH80_20925 [Mycobacterium hodleri]|uniref:PE-PPE domain-containing protein n=2 Tax=Mycolicibacterium hodleri TaxID=49897 RepID=A0A502E4M0_9MYCO|nr:hypothetical protein EAH80_20925 [Mycolicibacterium hodleri]
MSPYVTAGVALVGASLIAVTPIAPQASAARPEHRAVAMDVSLAAATCVTTDGAVCGGADAPATYPTITANNIFNIPVNLFNAIVSIPAAEVAGMNLLAKSLEETGSLLVWSPTNAFGFDQADPDKLRAIYNLLIPFPALSSVIGEQAVVWAQANFPVNAGCAALPGACPDPAAILSETLKVPTSQLYSGYTFPAKVNPFDGSSVGYPDGYVQLDPDAPGKAFLASLVATPTGPQSVTLAEAGAAFARLGSALFNSFYPFVQNSEYYNPDETGLAYVFRALSPILCGNCNRDPADGYAGVYQPKYLYGNYDPHYPPGQGPATVAKTTDTKTALATTADPGATAVEVTPSSAAPPDDSSADLAKAVKSLNAGSPAAQAVTTPDTAPAAQVKKDSFKATPGQVGPKHRKSGGSLADAMKSLQDNINGFKGGTKKAGDATKSSASVGGGEVGTADSGE